MAFDQHPLGRRDLSQSLRIKLRMSFPIKSYLTFKAFTLERIPEIME